MVSRLCNAGSRSKGLKDSRIQESAIDWLGFLASRVLEFLNTRVLASSPPRVLASSHLSDINQPAFRRDRDRLSSANRIQLFQNNLHVAFHRVLTDVKDLTDFFVALADTHLLENLKLALGELRLRHGVRELRGDVMR